MPISVSIWSGARLLVFGAASMLLTACSSEVKTDPELAAALTATLRPVTADIAFARSTDYRFICIGSGAVRPSDHISALIEAGHLETAPSGQAFASSTEIGSFSYDITLIGDTHFDVYPINARELGWPHASAGCYHAEGFLIGAMDTGAGMRVATQGTRVNERGYWRE